MSENNSREPVVIQPIGPIYPGGGSGGYYPPFQQPQYPFPYPPLDPGPVIPDYPSIKIKSISQNAYVILGYENILYAVGQSSNQGTTFKMIPLNNYQVKIRSINGRFIRVNRDDMLIADSNLNNATIFNLFKTGDMEFSLMATNGYYVRVREKDGALLARSEVAGPRTRFKFRRVQ